MIGAGLALLSAAPAHAGTAYEGQQCPDHCYGPYAVYADTAHTATGNDVALDAPNDVTVATSAGASSVTITDGSAAVIADPTTGCRQAGLHAATCVPDASLATGGPPFAFLGVAVDLGGGDDRYTSMTASSVPIGVSDGPGDDVLTGGPGRDFFTLLDGNDFASTGDGNDAVELFGRTGRDVALTGAGDDSVTVATTGTGYVATGDGSDQVSVSESGGVVIDLGDGDDTAFVSAAGPVSIRCGPGNDRVFLDAGATPTLAPDCETVTVNP